MPEFHVMPLTEAPQPISKARLAQKMLYEEFIKTLEADQAGQLTPSEGENTRGIKLRLSRAAKALDKQIDVWDFEGNVYFRLSAPAKTGRRGRPRKQV